MTALLGQGLALGFFAEPEAVAGVDPDKAERYRRVPWCYVMEWRKPGWGAAGETFAAHRMNE